MILNLVIGYMLDILDILILDIRSDPVRKLHISKTIKSDPDHIFCDKELWISKVSDGVGSYI